MKRTILLISILMVFALACTSGLPLPGSAVQTPAAMSAPASSSASGSLAALYERVNPGVVAIHTYTEAGESLGSGIVVDTEGHIITNQHVVEGAQSLEVDFPSGLMVSGKVIAQDPDSDLAVVLVDAPAGDLHPLTLGDSDLVKVGDAVVAIGNPFGLNGTMTLGIVSAKGRSMDSQHETATGSGSYYAAADLIQTDAAINPGNSGGPLLNLAGEVVGMNRAIISPSASTSGVPVNSGVGLATASNVIRRVLPSLLQNGKYAYPYVGISALSSMTLRLQQSLGLPYSRGVYILAVSPDGPADRAGLRGGTNAIEGTDVPGGGDLILAINAQTVQTFADFYAYLFYHAVPGDTIRLTIWRDGGEQDVSVVVAARS